MPYFVIFFGLILISAYSFKSTQIICQGYPELNSCSLCTTENKNYVWCAASNSSESFCFDDANITIDANCPSLCMNGVLKSGSDSCHSARSQALNVLTLLLVLFLLVLCPICGICGVLYFLIVRWRSKNKVAVAEVLPGSSIIVTSQPPIYAEAQIVSEDGNQNNIYVASEITAIPIV